MGCTTEAHAQDNITSIEKGAIFKYLCENFHGESNVKFKQAFLIQNVSINIYFVYVL